MLERIDKWLIDHNFNPIFNKDLAPDRQAERIKNEQEAEYGLQSALAVFRAAQEQLNSALSNLKSSKKSSQQAIKEKRQEIKSEEQHISQIDGYMDETRRIKKNIDFIVGGNIEDLKDQASSGKEEEE